MECVGVIRNEERIVKCGSLLWNVMCVGVIWNMVWCGSARYRSVWCDVECNCDVQYLDGVECGVIVWCWMWCRICVIYNAVGNMWWCGMVSDVRCGTISVVQNVDVCCGMLCNVLWWKRVVVVRCGCVLWCGIHCAVTWNGASCRIM